MGGANLGIGLACGGPRAGWPILAALAVGGVDCGVSITLWVAGARDLGAARGQLVFAAALFVGAIVAWTVFSDDVSTRQVIALAIAAFGVSFVLGSDHRHEHHHLATDHDHDRDHDDDGHHDHEHPDRVSGRHMHPHGHSTAAAEHSRDGAVGNCTVAETDSQP